jgi:hypothetical protein
VLRVALWSGAVAVLAVAALVLTLLHRADTANALAWLVTLISVLTLVFPLALRRYDRLALAWFRIRNRIWHSPSLPWRLSVGLVGDFDSAGYFDRVEKDLRRTMPGRVRVLRPVPTNGRQLAVDGLGLVELAIDDLSEDTRMTISFTGLRVAPHEAERVLDREVLPLVRTIESAADNPGREQSWSLRVSLDAKSNPYLPILLRDRDPANVSVFQVSYKRPHTTDRVDLGKEAMHVSAATAESFSVLVRDFVTFSGRGLQPPEAHA